jgi:hypothetical protein
MRSPNESLDELFAAIPNPAEPPSRKVIGPSGDVELLKPVADSLESIDMPEPESPEPLAQRALAIGAGAAFAILAFALLSGIFFGMQDSASSETSDAGQAAVEPEAEKTVRAPKEPGPFTSFPAKDSTTGFDVSLVASDSIRATTPRELPLTAAYRPARRSVPRPRMVVTGFRPTKLVIYRDNGVIKTRIEPQFAAISKPLTFPN